MPLVEYSDSDNSDSSPLETPQIRGTKRKRPTENPPFLPPLPSTFHDLYATTSRPSNQDDPDLHGGRQRMTPHIEGNWPTHVYIEWRPSTEHSNQLNDLLNSISQNDIGSGERKIHSLLKSDLGAELPLHISLSRSLSLRGAQRQAFSDALTTAVNKGNISPFKIPVVGYHWVSNYEKNRWFLVLKLAKPAGNELNKLLRIPNEVCESFDQPPLYARPRVSNRERNKRRVEVEKLEASGGAVDKHDDASDAFHVSIAWMLHPPKQILVDGAEKTSFDMQGIEIDVQVVKLKMGNQIISIPLGSKIDSLNKIIEKCLSWM
ncbi:poly(U)-specific 3'-to-5' RNA exonuclease [Lecanora helva]